MNFLCVSTLKAKKGNIEGTLAEINNIESLYTKPLFSDYKRPEMKSDQNEIPTRFTVLEINQPEKENNKSLNPAENVITPK